MIFKFFNVLKLSILPLEIFVFMCNKIPSIDMYVRDNYAYVADGKSGLVVIDISNPENPTLTADMPHFVFYGISGN